MPMLILATSILVSVIVIIGACEYLYSLETPKSYFKDYSELEKSGLIGKGWVAEFIPKSAYEIHEQHDLDTNRVEMSFKFNPSDTATMASACMVREDKDSTIYLCQDTGSEIKIIINNGHAKYSSKSI